MSIESRDWQQSEALEDRLGQPSTLHFPDDWTLSESWQRAQRERDRGGSINDAERMVWLEESDTPKRVTFALRGGSVRAECSCASHQYRGWCAHIASCWWRWVRGRIVVSHLDTGREYHYPPSWLRFDEDEDRTRDRDRDLAGLTSAELDAYLTCELGDVGVREYARLTGRSPGTVGNLLSRARDVGGES